MIRIVDNFQDVKEFHSVPNYVYAADPNYIPHLIEDIEAVFDPLKNPSFQRGKAVRWVIPQKGRIAAFYTDKEGRRFGGWGFFESVDSETAAKLIATAETWLKQQNCQRIQAPINFGSRDQFWGLLLESDANSSPSYQENYNPRVYRNYLEQAGYQVDFEQITFEMSPNDVRYERFQRIALRTYSQAGYRYSVLDFGRLDKFAADFVEVYNAAWSFHEDFEPLDVTEVRKKFRAMRWAVLPELVVFAYFNDRPIGFYINILELNQVFRFFGGRKTWWNQLRFLWLRNRIDKVRGLVFGIVPEFQNRGVEAGMIVKSYEGLKKIKKISRVELSWIGDFNPKMISMLRALGAVESKKHATFFKYFFE
jgi:hypothetical protein